jgi:integrase
LQAAVQEQVLSINVATLVEKRKGPTRKATAWTVADLEQFQASIVDHPLRAGFELSCLGLRRGEVVGLQWDDVDLDAMTIDIRNTFVMVNGKAEASTPKSERSNRRLPIDQVPGLRVRAPGATVLTDALGMPLRPEFYGDELTRAMRAAGVPVITVHGIRHTAVTVMLGRGIPVHDVAAWHGHDPAMTLRVYAHATPNSLGLAAAALARRRSS